MRRFLTALLILLLNLILILLLMCGCSKVGDEGWNHDPGATEAGFGVAQSETASDIAGLAESSYAPQNVSDTQTGITGTGAESQGAAETPVSGSDATSSDTAGVGVAGAAATGSDVMGSAATGATSPQNSSETSASGTSGSSDSGASPPAGSGASGASAPNTSATQPTDVPGAQASNTTGASTPNTPGTQPSNTPGTSATGSTASPQPTTNPAPYSLETGDTVLKITGDGVTRDYYFTLAELKSLSQAIINDDYFSRGKEPKEATNHYTGVLVKYLLDSVAELSPQARKAYFTASDGYSACFTMAEIRSEYLDETVPGKTLYMILAWEEDSRVIPLKLVMGQNIEGEYNRQFWVREVITIEVRA